MKFVSVLFLFILLCLNSFKLQAEDALTIKQQLDRIMEEVKDLNKAVFNKSFDNKELYSNEIENDAEKFTSIDIRIYDLDKDIKGLTLQFEEILFKIDDLSNIINLLENDLNESIQKIQNNLSNENVKSDNKIIDDSKNIKKENNLGTLVISDKIEDSSSVDSENLTNGSEKLKKDEEDELNILSPEELLQFALDQMMKKNYDKSKKILENFVVKFPDNQLSGSAHFWLGKIYLFESNYRKAAIVFGEGVQKFPKSIKAAEMYYELAKSLKEMNKFPEACKTLTLLNDIYQDSNFTKDPEKIKDKLNCVSEN